MGLKGLVDFVNQLNILDLEKLLLSGEPEGFNLLKLPEPVTPETFCQYLKNVPPLQLIKFMNPQKASEIQKAVKKISSHAHFGQSMTDFFARDDALEPALVICEVLRGKEDMGEVLEKRGASFLALAQPYEKHRSTMDHDAISKKFTRISQRLKSSKKRRLVCFSFQRGRCNFENCLYKHECSRCGSSNHGERKCRRRRRRSTTRSSAN